jgi:bifunctional UDP-N-acetylglucosamine pyrophosphorylase/glucosamine-1-phosphate N-acetyltransferase
MNTNIIILAAGRGKRMESTLPKVLVPFMGIPMIKHVIKNTINISTKTVIVVGYKKKLVEDELKQFNLKFVTQNEQLGTAHAVLITEHEFKGYNGDIIILFGDSPLISKSVIQNLIKFHKNNKYISSILTKDSETPGGAARIIRNKDGNFMKSIENKDLQLEEHKNIKEINVGVMIINSTILFETLKKVNNNNSQNEYYLPDVINILSQNNDIGVFKSTLNEIPELFAFNTLSELKKAEKIYIL